MFVGGVLVAVGENDGNGSRFLGEDGFKAGLADFSKMNQDRFPHEILIFVMRLRQAESSYFGSDHHPIAIESEKRVHRK